MKNFIFFFLLSASMFSQKNIIDDNNLKQGYWELYFPRNEGVISEKGFFNDDEESGMWARFHDNGIIREIVNYREGLSHGTRILLDKKGKLTQQENYKLNNLHGLQRYFHDTGKLKMEVNYDNGVLSGQFMKYYRNGKKQESCFYKDGFKHGKSFWFFENESISIEYPYEKGEINGIAKTFFNDGTLKSESTYLNNDLIVL